MNNTFSISKALNFGWNEFKNNWKFWIIIFLLAMSFGFNDGKTKKEEKKVHTGTTITNNSTVSSNVLGAESEIYSHSPYLVEQSGKDMNRQTFNGLISKLGPFAVVLVPYSIITGILFIALVVLKIAASIILNMGFVKAQLSAVREGRHDYKTLLSEVSVKKALRLLLLEILYMLLVAFGFLFLVIPGIYFAIKYIFVATVFIDKDVSIGEAFKISGRMTSKNKLKLIGFFMIGWLMVFIGVFAFIVGIIPAVLVFSLAISYIYVELADKQNVVPVPAVVEE